MFIHSPVEGHLSCFYFLVLMNNAAMNIHVQVLYEHKFSFLLGGYLGEKLLGHMSWYVCGLEIFREEAE